MRLVVDASAIIDLLVGGARGDWVRGILEGLRGTAPMTVAHLDAEVLSGLARLHRADVLDAGEVEDHLALLADVTMERVAVSGPLLRAAWCRRHNVAAKDALYVAAAEAARARLLTTDDRLARAVPDLAVPL